MEKLIKFKSFYKEASTKLNLLIEKFNEALKNGDETYFFKDIDKILKNIDNNIKHNENDKDNNNKISNSNSPSFLSYNLSLLSNLNSGGKLIRGILIALGYKLMNKNNTDEYDKSLALSVAYELFQTSILIHDDVIDNDDKRRGKDTVHFENFKRITKIMGDKEQNKNLTEFQSESKKTSESVAICVGDYGFFRGNGLIVDMYGNNENFIRLFRKYTNIVLRTVEGEMLDVILSFEGKVLGSKNYKVNAPNDNNNKIQLDSQIYHPNSLEDSIFLIYKLKTAYYTITGPISLGLILNGASDENVKDLEIFGEKVGIAFQIQDDIIGIYGENIGKVVGSDIKEFKMTILYSYTIKDDKYKEKLMKYYGKESISEDDIKETREIFKESGAYEYAKKVMNNMYDESIEILKGIKWINDENKDILEGFVEYLRNRKL